MNPFEIIEIKGREILDCRGDPTLQVDVITREGIMGRADVPNGRAKGKYEALELRGGGRRFQGRGVLKAVKKVNEIVAPSLKGHDVTDQRQIDSLLIELDGTENKARLGANAILGTSLAVCKAAAISKKVPLFRYIGGEKADMLPIPMMNIVNGGAHADNNVDLQEFMIMPIGAPSFKEALRMGSEVFHNLKSILKSKKLSTAVGDEGGFAPDLKSNEEAVDVILEAIKKAGYKAGSDIFIALDPASSSFFTKGKYMLEAEEKKENSAEDMIDFYARWVDKYPIVSIEDGLAEDDWDGWKKMTEKLGSKIQLVGDDLFVTNTKRLTMGIEKGIANSILIKVNQIGTLTETKDAIAAALRAGYTAVISHRSGETEDTTIAHLVVAMNTGQIKTGSVCRTDRICKYNELLRIEDELGNKARYGSAIWPKKS